jgi:Flp pilus assembly protein TadG
MLARRMRLRSEGAQVLLVTALLIPVLLGMAAIAVDVGSYADDKRNLQNAADAIALAASRDMCTPDPHDCSNTSAALATADAYAAKNNIDTSIMTVSFLGGSTAPKVG